MKTINWYDLKKGMKWETDSWMLTFSHIDWMYAKWIGEDNKLYTGQTDKYNVDELDEFIVYSL